MNKEKMKAHLPTVTGYLEKEKAKQNRLPKHLRAPEIWPLWIQVVLNSGLIIALSNLMVDRDDFLTEAGPAIALVVCLLLLIYTLITAVRLRAFYRNIRGQRLAKINFFLMILAFLFWAGASSFSYHEMMLEGLSLFFPCHNEEANVEAVILDALRIAPQVAKQYEVIIIDDGSTDRTAEIAKRFCEPSHPVRLVRHDHCKGYGEALKSGFRAARQPWIFYSDGDRQFDLTELPRLVEWTNRFDIVSGYRARRADAWHRTLNARIYALALRGMFGLTISDVNGAFKLYRRDIFEHIRLKCSGALINAEIFAKAKRQGYTVSMLPVTHRPRMAGRQSGAQLKVIGKAMREFITLWWDLRTSRDKK